MKAGKLITADEYDNKRSNHKHHFII